jgi:hypothetical protein
MNFDPSRAASPTWRNPAERVVAAFYIQRGTAEQYIKERKGAIKMEAAVAS